jgi:tripeptidyl-peptidase I
MANNACHADGGNDCIEANLDVQYLMAISQVTPTTYFYWNGTDWMLDWLIYMTNMQNPPLVNSISYASYETSYDSSYAQQFATEAMKLGAMGVTLLSASGDDGVAGYQARGDPFYCGYFPQFPATSPYVTAVGGTMGPETGDPEIACQAQLGGVITTGGGFSTLYAAPSWQQGVISTYFSTMASGPSSQVPAAGYIASGRGYPDVSGLAANYEVMIAGSLGGVYGTSASTPMFSGEW